MTQSIGAESDIVKLQRVLYNSTNPTRRWLHLSRRERVENAIKKAPLAQRLRALEVGPGSGIYLPLLCQEFKNVTAVDIEQVHIDELGRHTNRFQNLRLVLADFTQLQCEDQFDLVLCSEVIEHVSDPASFMRALSRAVKPGGVLVLSTPQPWSWMEATCRLGLSPLMIGLVRRVYREPVLKTGHISLMSKKKLVALLNKFGFVPTHTEFFGLYFPILAEFGGALAVKILSFFEPRMQFSPFSFLLWTQLYVARRAGPK